MKATTCLPPARIDLPVVVVVVTMSTTTLLLFMTTAFEVRAAVIIVVAIPAIIAPFATEPRVNTDAVRTNVKPLSPYR